MSDCIYLTNFACRFVGKSLEQNFLLLTNEIEIVVVYVVALKVIE